MGHSPLALNISIPRGQAGTPWPQAVKQTLRFQGDLWCSQPSADASATLSYVAGPAVFLQRTQGAGAEPRDCCTAFGEA